MVKGKPFQSIEQLKKFKKIGEIEVVKLKPVIVEEVKKDGDHADG